jgi:colanic acid biosynthesis glycosyl transferase WcaI
MQPLPSRSRRMSQQSKSPVRMEKTLQKQRLWIVSELYYPELTSTGHYITAIAESLADELDVRVICGQPNYSARGSRMPAAESLNNVQIKRVWSLTLDKNILLFRLLNMLSLSIAVWLKAIACFRKNDSVLVVTSPPLLPIVTAAAALHRGVGYTLLVHDLYPEQLIATGVLSTGSYIAATIDISNRWVYKHAQQIIAVGRDMKQVLEKKTAGLQIPSSYIPNWSDTAQITPQPRGENTLLGELKLLDKFMVLSAGNFGRPNDLETVVNAAKILTSNEAVHFLFIGNGARERWLQQNTADLPNVTILPSMPREEQNVFLNACDVTLASLVHGMWGAAVPSRIYNYMAAGKPVIAVCEERSEMARLVTEEEAGLVVRPGDPKELAVAVRKLMDSPEVVTAMSKNARAAALRNYSAETVLKQYLELMIPAR